MPLFALPPLHYTFYVDARERFERRLNKDFDSAVSDNRSDLFSRWRVGAKLTFGKQWKGELQYQYAHDEAWTKARNFSVENSDLSLAYAETSVNGWTIDLGRQKINIGQQRLIGSFEWNNVGRSFDAVRVRNKVWDAFAFKIGVGSPKPRDARVFGLVHASSLGDTIAAFKHDKGVDLTTIDHNVTHAFGSITVDAEGAIQFGKVSGNDQRAWALHVRGTAKAGSAVKVFAEVNAASGGPKMTFDNLYPTNHSKYGIADMIAWKNMEHFAVGAEFSLRKNLNMKASWNAYSLRDARDAWYGAGGAPNTHAGTPLKDASGASGRDLGNEFDLDSNYTISKTASISAGVAMFNPGSFVRNVTGHSDRQLWGYMQLAFRF
jgi:hypothetical protein